MTLSFQSELEFIMITTINQKLKHLKIGICIISNAQTIKNWRYCFKKTYEFLHLYVKGEK